MVTFPWFFTKSARKSTEFWKNYQIHGHFFLIIIGKGARREPPQAPPRPSPLPAQPPFGRQSLRFYRAIARNGGGWVFILKAVSEASSAVFRLREFVTEASAAVLLLLKAVSEVSFAVFHLRKVAAEGSAAFRG